MSDFFKNFIIPAISVLTAVFVGISNYYISQLKSDLDKQRQQIDELTAVRNVKKLDDDLVFRIYEAVEKSLSGNAKQQQAATALVIVMAPDTLRSQLLQVIGQSESTDSAVKASVAEVLKKEQEFKIEDKTAPVAAPVASTSGTASRGWNVDVFWCERSGESARTQANALEAALKAAGSYGRLRVRLLPDSINSRAGYGLAGYAVRREASEKEAGEQLLAITKKTIGGETPVGVDTVSSATPGYLSAFMCP